MNSIHYPSLAPVQVQPQRKDSVPGLSQRRESRASNCDSRRKSSSSAARDDVSEPPDDPESRVGGEWESSAKRKRTTFPPIAQGRVIGDNESSVTSPDNGRHSMTEVMARMRVREKTLMGEELLKGRQQPLSPVSGSTPAQADPALPSKLAAASDHQGQRETLPNMNGSGVGGSGASDVRKAWETPKNLSLDSPRHPKSSAASTLVVGFHIDSGEVEAEDRPCENEPDGAGKTSSPLEGTQARGEGQEDEDDDEDDDDDFDFDEDEEPVQESRGRGTGAVYQRACQALKIQPSPAFLRQCRLSVMALRDVRLGPADVKPIAIALVNDYRVNYLDLSNNDLGPLGVSYVAEMLLENNSIVDLNLSATKPGHEGVKALRETLQHNSTLVYLRLEENGIEHTESQLLADMIRFIPKLRGLYLGHNRLGYSGGVAIASAIAQNTCMQTLDLQWNHIRRDSAVALVRSLETNKQLKRLNLAWNGLGKEGCLALAHVLPKNSSLRELDLTCNRVDFMSLGFLLSGVTANTSLTCLKIGQNPLTTDGAKALIRAIDATPQLNISELDVGGVPVDMQFAKMLANVQKTRALRVTHEETVSLATSDRKREHDGNNLDRFDPVMVLFEYMKLDNLRVIDMFQFMDVKKRDKLSKGNIREGLITLKIPVTEHAIDVIFQKLDLNRDGFVELDEMMKVQRDTARVVKLRQIKAKAKKKEDGGLTGLHQALREIIAKRKEEQEAPSSKQQREAKDKKDSTNVISTTKTSGGGRTSSVGGLQLTQARYSVTSPKRRVGESDEVADDVEKDL